MTQSKAVIIGAGQTGRGYAARHLAEKNYQITFIDINEQLVEYLQEDKRYCIHFYDMDRTPFSVEGFSAYGVNDVQAGAAVLDADFIYTAVGEQNLSAVAAFCAPALKQKHKQTVFMTNENGINPARVLREALNELGIKEHIIVSQTAVFCSTINVNGTRLDILSQNMSFYPYDADELKGAFDLHGAVPVHNFERFLQRKIYTYNCLAGLISYIGYIKGYTIFGDAANDLQISDLMDHLLVQLNPALALFFDISLEEQTDFSVKALEKFKNRNILDYVIKNGRAAKRKFGKTERIVAPMTIIEDNNGDASIMYLIAAAALCYWSELSENGQEIPIEGNPIDAYCNLRGISKESDEAEKVAQFYNYIIEHRDSIDLNIVLNK